MRPEVPVQEHKADLKALYGEKRWNEGFMARQAFNVRFGQCHQQKETIDENAAELQNAVPEAKKTLPQAPSAYGMVPARALGAGTRDLMQR